MKDIIEELLNLMSNCPFPVPNPADLADKAFAEECGIDLDFECPAQPAG